MKNQKDYPMEVKEVFNYLQSYFENYDVLKENGLLGTKYLYSESIERILGTFLTNRLKKTGKCLIAGDEKINVNELIIIESILLYFKYSGLVDLIKNKDKTETWIVTEEGVDFFDRYKDRINIYYFIEDRNKRLNELKEKFQKNSKL